MNWVHGTRMATVCCNSRVQQGEAIDSSRCGRSVLRCLLSLLALRLTYMYTAPSAPVESVGSD